MVYDITDAESFNKVKNWVKELRKIVGSEITIVIAGNKMDLEKNRNVSEEDAISYAQSVSATHFNCSAKANRGLDEVFTNLSQSKCKIRGRGGLGGIVHIHIHFLYPPYPPTPLYSSWLYETLNFSLLKFCNTIQCYYRDDGCEA